MEKHTIYIKNMVCNRCIMVVETELQKLGIHYTSVELGEVSIDQPLSAEKKASLKSVLESLGFELIDDKKSRLIEQIKVLIIDLVQQKDGALDTPLSHYITQHIHHDYQYLSNLFSEVEGITIEKYFILQKIEKVKELLVYDELTLSEIAYRLNYSSTAYLSSQFKKVTGLTPSHFKKIGTEKRKPLDKV